MTPCMRCVLVSHPATMPRSLPFTSNGPESGQLHLQYELHVETI